MLIGAKNMEDFLRFLEEGKTSLSLAQEIGIVILGSCASGNGNLYEEGVGLSTVEGEPTLNINFWRHHLNGVSGNVLVLTECCGQYAPSQLEWLRGQFPAVSFIAPQISDYCDNFEPKRVREDLLRVGVIKIG